MSGVRRSREFSIQPEKRISEANPNLGYEIKLLRVASATTQHELGQAMNVGQDVICRLENGHNLSWKNFLRTCHALGIQVRLVFEQEDIDESDAEIWADDWSNSGA